MNLREQARGRDCQIRLPQICNFDPATTVLCHYRLVGLSGMGMRSPDVFAAHGCSKCHSVVDTSKDPEIVIAFLQGVIRTQALLVKEGIIKW
jgi:hypothetical protein